MEIVTNSAYETKQLGHNLASQLRGGEVVCLYGELGSGKTTFVTGSIQYFLPKKRVLSPTFIIVRRYDIPKKSIRIIYHIDLYRVGVVHDRDELGLNEILSDKSAVVFLEWANWFNQGLPKQHIEIHFDQLADDKRKILIKKYD